MGCLKKIKLMSITVMVCVGLTVSVASAGKKIVMFNEGVTATDKDQYVVQWEPQGVSLVMNLPFINSIAVSVPDTITAADLANNPIVASVEEDQPMELQALVATGDGGAGDGGAGDGGATSFIEPVPMPPTSERPWGIISLYGSPYDPWSYLDYFNKNQIPEIVKEALKEIIHVKVAILDTGVDFNHEKIKGYVMGGIDYVNFAPGIPMDDNGHGTHIAGTLTAKELGIAFRVWLYAVKILDQDATGDISTLLMALQWATDNDMDVINMSIAFAEDNPAVRLAIQKAYEAGIIMVAAAGNHSNWVDDGATGDGGAGDGGAATDGTTENPYPVMYPAKYPEVIAVGAIDSFEEMTDFSNTGPEVDILAPGANVLSTDLGGGYGICNGTSMATPHVTGTMALMKSLAMKENKTLTPADAATILRQTALNSNVNLVGALEDVKYVLP